jgi:hypothetical protein
MANFMNIGSVICKLLLSDGETHTAKLVPLCKRDEKLQIKHVKFSALCVWCYVSVAKPTTVGSV